MSFFCPGEPPLILPSALTGPEPHEPSPSSHPWLDSQGRKLQPHRWHFWGVHLPAIDDGASWTFSTLPPATAWPNHRSATVNSLDVHDQLDTLASEGLIEWCVGPVAYFVNNFNPFGAVTKPDGTFRILVDPSITGVNDHMLRLPLTLPTVREALLLTSPGSILGKRDLSRGFYHVLLHPSARPYMGFRDPLTHRIGRWVCLPFGASQSPAIFCEITQAAAKIFNHLFAEFGGSGSNHSLCG
jgi:hypothetical protein